MTMRRLTLALALALGATPAMADQRDSRLDPLFERLRTAASPAESLPTESQIWQIWLEAGDAATDSLMQLGLQAMQTGNLPGALALFDAVTTQKPDFAEGWNKRATVLYMLGAHHKSAEDVARVLALEPRHFGALSGLGLIEMARGNADAALSAFERALAVHPTLPAVKAHAAQLRKRKRDNAI